MQGNTAQRGHLVRPGSTTNAIMDDRFPTGPGSEDETDRARGGMSVGGAMRGAVQGEEGLEARGMLAGLRARMFGKTDERLQIGEFRVLRKVGSGGMGVVYEAYDPRLQRHVAVKVVKEMYAAGHDDLRREARAIAKVTHPNVITVHEVGTEGNELFVAMEYVAGGDLLDWAKTPHSWREIVDVYRQAGAGLMAAHEAGLVHGDFKPQNALLGEDGRVRVLDFGLARRTGGASEDKDARITQPDLAMAGDANETLGSPNGGTPRYMAPEQYGGLRASAASDQFSFCVALFETLHGRHPFAADDHDWSRPPSFDLRAVQAHDGSGQTPVPTWIHRAVLRGLNPDPDLRWPRLSLLVEELARDPSRRRRQRIIAGGLALAVSGLVGGYGYAEHLRTLACTTIENELAGVWDTKRSTAMKAAIESGGQGYSAAAARQAARVLDNFAERWVDARTSACEIEQARGFVANRQSNLQSECLQSRKDELEAVVDALSSGDAATAMNAVETASSLPPVSTCNDEKTLRSQVAPLADAAKKAEIRETRKQLSQAWALLLAGDYAAPGPIAEAALKTAKSLKYLPLIAEAENGVGEVLFVASASPAQALPHFEAAIWAGTQSRHDRIVAVAAAMVPLSLARQGKHEEADRWLEFARAAIERFGKGGREEAFFHNNLGAMYGERSDPQRAIVEGRIAVELKSKIWGPNNIDVAKSINNIAAFSEDLGDFASSRAAYEDSLQRMRAAGGGELPTVGFTLANLGNLQCLMGELDAAQATLNESRTLLNSLLGREHPWTSAPMIGLCRLSVERGHFDQAVTMCGDAITRIGQAFGEDSMHIAEIRGLRARAHIGLHDDRAALDDLLAATHILSAGEIVTPRFAEIKLTHAQLLTRAGQGEQEQARALAESARDAFASVGSGWDAAQARAETLVRQLEAERGGEKPVARKN